MKTERAYRLDPLALETLETITATLRERIRLTRADTRPSTVIRRSLEVYAAHLQSVAANEDELRLRIEWQRVREHTREQASKAQRKAAIAECQGFLREITTRRKDT